MVGSDGSLQQKQAGETGQAQGSFDKANGPKPIIATARPGLAGVESALMKRLPANYGERTVREALSYLVSGDVKDVDAQTVASLKKELGAAGSVVTINGRDAKLTDNIGQYLVEDTKEVGGKRINYQKLEIEVTAVQQGGFY